MKGLLFTILLSYGGAAASPFRPFYGLLIYVSFAILRPETLWFWSVPQGGNYSRILAGGMLLGWALHGFGRWRLGPARGIVGAVLLFWLWSILGAAFAPHKDAAWLFVEDISKIVLPLLVGFTVIESKEQLNQLVWVIVASQGYVSWEANSLYFSTPTFGFELLEAMAGVGRAVLGTSLVCTIPLAVFLVLTARATWQRGLALLCLVLIGHTVFLTFSRGALLGLLGSGFVFFLLMPRKGQYVWVLPVVAFVGFMMTGPQVWQRFGTVFSDTKQRDASAQSRIELWQNCLAIIPQRPLMGVGPDHFLLVSRKFGWDKPKEAHNLWLQIAAELGLPGVLGLFGYYALTGRRLLPLARRGSDDPWFQWAAVSVVSALAGFLICSCFVTVQRLEVPYYVALVGASLIKLAARPAKQAAEYVPLGDGSQKTYSRICA
jgi:probable O-glycosylation ligase (exosortase A-associated)